MKAAHIEGRFTRTPGQQNLTIIAALLTMVGPFTIDAYLPSFPDIEVEFDISRAVLSQSLGGYLAAVAISTLFWGPLSDRIGRRAVILMSMSLYVLASIGCALADDANTFLLLRVLQGLAASGSFVAGRAMIRDVHDAQAAHRAMSQVMLLFALAPAIAPVLGGWLHDLFGWRSIFWFLSGFGILLIGLTSFIKETLAIEYRQSFHPLAVIRTYARTLRHGRFLALVFGQSFVFSGMFLYIAGAPTVIYDFLELGSDSFGLQFIPMVGGLMLGSYISSRLALRWPIQRTVTAGFGVMGLAVLFNLTQASFLDVSILAVIGPLVLYTLGLAMFMPAITILALDCIPLHRGMAAAMQGFIQMLITAGVASIAVPILHTKLQHFVLGQVAFLLMALTLWFIVGQRVVPGPENAS
ncbi:MAG: Bcr/CflA family drug resistance efflux transporter [Deltaproteobacteria bacterium]|nr:MAG: Bcr/CflA family drug resistance efflux transporter [Deltaproteobacteria bacterium]